MRALAGPGADQRSQPPYRRVVADPAERGQCPPVPGRTADGAPALEQLPGEPGQRRRVARVPYHGHARVHLAGPRHREHGDQVADHADGHRVPAVAQQHLRQQRRVEPRGQRGDPGRQHVQRVGPQQRLDPGGRRGAVAARRRQYPRLVAGTGDHPQRGLGRPPRRPRFAQRGRDERPARGRGMPGQPGLRDRAGRLRPGEPVGHRLGDRRAGVGQQEVGVRRVGLDEVQHGGQRGEPVPGNDDLHPALQAPGVRRAPPGQQRAGHLVRGGRDDPRLLEPRQPAGAERLADLQPGPLALPVGVVPGRRARPRLPLAGLPVDRRPVRAGEAVQPGLPGRGPPGGPRWFGEHRGYRVSRRLGYRVGGVGGRLDPLPYRIGQLR